MKTVLIFFSLLLSFVFMVNTVYAESNEMCTLLEAEELIRDLKNKSGNKMLIIDHRSRSKISNGRIPSALDGISGWTADFLRLYKGADVVVVEQDTPASEIACQKTLNLLKGHDLGHFYFLKGGMNAWTGPLAYFKGKDCEGVSAQDLMALMESGEKVGIIDLRSPDDYDKGHIPGAVLVPSNSTHPKFKLGPLLQPMRESNMTIVFYDYEGDAGKQNCIGAKWGSEYQKIYYLKDGMKAWDGPVEKGHGDSN